MVFTFLMQRDAASFFFVFVFCEREECAKGESHVRGGDISRRSPRSCLPVRARPMPSSSLPGFRRASVGLETQKKMPPRPAGWLKSFHRLQTHSLLLVKSYQLKHLFYLWTGSYSCGVIFEPWTDVHSERRPRSRICWIRSCVRRGDESGRTG